MWTNWTDIIKIKGPALYRLAAIIYAMPKHLIVDQWYCQWGIQGVTNDDKDGDDDIYIMMKCLSVCHEKWSLPIRLIWAPAISWLWPSDDDDDNDDDDDGDGDGDNDENLVRSKKQLLSIIMLECGYTAAIYYSCQHQQHLIVLSTSTSLPLPSPSSSLLSLAKSLLFS